MAVSLDLTWVSMNMGQQHKVENGEIAGYCMGSIVGYIYIHIIKLYCNTLYILYVIIYIYIIKHTIQYILLYIYTNDSIYINVYYDINYILYIHISTAYMISM